MNTPARPSIPGYAVQALLGSGGFADVYLATQTMPQREVAVKVLRAPVRDEAGRERFEAEANAMATLSSHPAIVTIHHASVTDAGYPYLVMEYCSRPTLAARYRSRPLSVPELLQTLIRLAGAVETAHRSGVMHGDIKPANILTTDYGWPALTDFGLTTLAGERTSPVEAVSVPWAAPEVVTGRAHDHRAGVYSLGATAYTLLAGRSPFGAADGEIDEPDSAALVARILATVAAPLGRDDVPEPLERLILLALAKNPDDRPQSASAFARSLQRIEQDMNLPATPLDIPAADLAGIREDTESEATRFVNRRSTAPVTQPHAAVAPARPVVSAAAAAPDPDDETRIVRRSPHDAAMQEEPAPGPADDATVIADRRVPAAPVGPAIRRPPAGPDGRWAYDPGIDGVAATRYETRARPVIDAPAFTRASDPLQQQLADAHAVIAEERARFEGAARRRRRRRLVGAYVVLGIVGLALVGTAAWFVISALVT